MRKNRADRGVGGLRRKAECLCEKEFTLALTPHKSLRSALLLILPVYTSRIGFAQSRGWFLFHQRIQRDPRRHDVERNLSLLEAFGVRAEECRRAIDLPISPAVQTRVDQKLRSLGISEGKPIMGVNPGCGMADQALVTPRLFAADKAYARKIRLPSRPFRRP